MDTAETSRLQTWREDTPGASNYIHFNNAGASMMPRSVMDAMHDHLELEGRIGGYEAAAATMGSWRSFYDSVGGLLKAPATNIALSGSATDAYNKALGSIPLREGDVVLTTRNDYVSNQIAFLQLRKLRGVEIIRAKDLESSGADPDHMRELIRKHRPRLVAVTHVPSTSGTVQAVAEIGELCREAGCLYLIDACQSIGQIDIDLGALHCDFLSATFRKFLRGPRGVGFLYVSDRVLATEMAPPFLDLHSASWTSPEAFEAAPTAMRFETWERSYALMQGARQAADYARAIGLPLIEKRVGKLATTLRQGLRNLDRVRVLDKGQKLGGIVSLTVEGYHSPVPLHEALGKRKINCSYAFRDMALLDMGIKDVSWILRFSPHYYNSESEVEQVVGALDEILREGK